METELSVHDIDGDFVETVGQAVAVGFHQIEQAGIFVRSCVCEREGIEVGADHEFDGSFCWLRTEQINARRQRHIAFVHDLQSFAIAVGDAFRVCWNADEAIAGIVEQIGQVGIEAIMKAQAVLRLRCRKRKFGEINAF